MLSQKILDEVKKTGEDNIARKNVIFKRNKEMLNVRLTHQQVMAKGWKTYPDTGLVFYGHFIANELEQGIIINEGKYKYEGDIKNVIEEGQMRHLKHGHGTMWDTEMATTKYRTEITSTSAFNTPIFMGEHLQTWVYDGEFADDKKNGQGIKAWVDHPEYDRYLGSYKDDIEEG